MKSMKKTVIVIIFVVQMAFYNICMLGLKKIYFKKKKPNLDFPGGAVVKNPPANAGDTGSSPGLGRSHMPQSN